MNLQVLENFEPIGLDNIGKANFMNRVDSKFPLSSEVLFTKVLPKIANDYYVLQINGLEYMAYETVYFDTPDNRFFTDHQNGKLDRYKVRKRSYLDTNNSFLEVKHKNNKGKTKKKRIEVFTPLSEITPEEYEFLAKQQPFNPQDLKKVITNRFHRITLVKKDMGERCTIDNELTFIDENASRVENGFSIVELKHEAHAPASPLRMALAEAGVKQQGFSKYCMGRVLNKQHGLKANIFKMKLRLVQKNAKVSL